jgi:putative oxidoreductase
MYQVLSILFLIGRIVSGGFFLMGGFNHFKNANMYAAYAGSKGVPAPKAAAVGTGVLLLLGGLSFLLGFHPTIGAALLLLFLLGVSFQIHNYWSVADPQAKQAEQVNFMKNMALAGFILMTLMIPRPWPISLGAIGR